MVELALAPLKVPRRAVRILVLTVRFATARRRATPPCWPRARPLSAHNRGGEVSVLGRSRVGLPIRHSTQGNGSGRLERINGFAVGLTGEYRCGLNRIKRGGGVGATCTIA